MGEMIVYGIKIAAAIGIGITLMTAITTLLNLLTQLVFGNVIGEVLGIISCCLPFDANLVFGALGTVIAGILSFLIAKKIFELTSDIFHLTA